MYLPLAIPLAIPIDRRIEKQIKSLGEEISQLDEFEACKDVSRSTVEKVNSVLGPLLAYFSEDVESGRVAFMEPELVLRFRQLQLRMISLEYRLRYFGNEAEERMFADPLVYQQLCCFAADWLNQQPLKSYREEGGVLVEVDQLCKKQKKALEEASRYPKFCEVVLKHEALRVDFFKWVLITNFPVDAFIEFYGTCQTTIKKAFLDKRIGYFIECPLKIEMRQKGERCFKRLTLPFETESGKIKRRSIHTLDKRIGFLHGVRETKREVFAHFTRKNETPGNFEMINGVVRNWNYFFGRFSEGFRGYVDFDLSTEDWYMKLPVFETLTEKQVRKYYSIKQPLEPSQCVLAICANRETSTMNILRTHGLFVLLMPDERGNYNMYPFTFLAREFTTGWQHIPAIDMLFKVLRLAKTERAYWAYPDETLFYTRQQAAYPIVISREKCLEHLEVLRHDFIQARKGNEHFQISYKNCIGSVQMQAQRVHSKVVVPSLATADMMESTATGFLGKIFDKGRQCSDREVMIWIWCIGFFLAAFRFIEMEREGRRIKVSMMDTPIFTTRKIFHASKLITRIEKNEVSGVIRWGHGQR